MMKSLRSRVQLLLVWGTAAGLSALPAEMAAQSGPGQPRGQLGAWMAEARASSFHASIQADAMANPVAGHAGQAGPGAPHRVPAGVLARPDSTVSPGKVFVSTLIGASIPFAPFMLYWHFWLDELPSQGDDPGLVLLLISSANLLSVPMAAGIAGVDSLGRTLVGTGLGFVLGTMVTQFTDLRGSEFTLAPPVFALTMAAVTTLAVTVYEGERRGPG